MGEGRWIVSIRVFACITNMVICWPVLSASVYDGVKCDSTKVHVLTLINAFQFSLWHSWFLGYSMHIKLVNGFHTSEVDCLLSPPSHPGSEDHSGWCCSISRLPIWCWTMVDSENCVQRRLKMKNFSGNHGTRVHCQCSFTIHSRKLAFGWNP